MLEKILARADVSTQLVPWRVQALRVLGLDSLAPTAGIAQARYLGAVAEPWVMLATPVHMAAGMSSIQLVADGVLSIDVIEAQELAKSFNAAFAGSGVRLVALGGSAEVSASARLLCLTERAYDVATRDPRDALGSDLWDFQPSGPDSARLRGLMSEIELWLFEHGSNARRVGRQELPITGLWMWAGGPTAATSLSEPSASGAPVFTGGEDPILSAINPQRGWPAAPASGVVVLQAVPGSAEWADVQLRWLEPALKSLLAGATEELHVSLGRQCFNLRARSWRRFWRRSRPWWEYLQHE